MNRFTKLDTTGADLPDDTTEWVAVRDNNLYIVDGERRQNIWPRGESPDRHSHKDASAAAAAYANGLCGWTDWTLPSIEQLATIAERSKIDPAIDTRYFDSRGNWVWSSTEEASDPGYAWYVSFDGGSVSCSPRYNSGFVRAVRSVALPPSQ